MDAPSRNASEPATLDLTVRELERELRAQRGRRWLRRLVTLLVLCLVVGGLYAYRRFTQPPPEPRFTSEAIERRDIVEEIQSSGSLKPLREVQVGAQVSGRVVSVHVDFNSKVTKGQLLAEIDPSLFGAQVSQSRAMLDAARAGVQRSEARLGVVQAQLARTRALQKDNLTTFAELEQVQAEHDVAQADVAATRAQLAQLQAQLNSASTTLAYTKIYSPIDGVVVSRAVDPGQTVAASFASPTLFVIAEDLSKMEVLADIDEADVGKLAEGMKADVVVDAFPEQKFPGTVTQVRYSPKQVQGVVTYSAVISVSNSERKLRPGMTATVSVKTREARGAKAVRNAALRFKPLPELDDKGKPKPQKPLPPIEPKQGRLFVVKGGSPGQEELGHEVVSLGITDGVWTELKEAPLEVGAKVVTEQREDPAKKPGPF
jgi:HlyD family secretion protein